MGKPLKVVVVGDAHAAALKVASDLEQGGYEPAVFLAAGEADLERIAPGCEIVLAWADATGVPPRRVLEPRPPSARASRPSSSTRTPTPRTRS